MKESSNKVRRVETSEYVLTTVVYFVVIAILLAILSRSAQANPGFLPYAVFADPLSLGVGGIVLVVLSLLGIAVILGLIHNSILYRSRARRGVTVDNLSEMEPPVFLGDSGALLPISGMIFGGLATIISVAAGANSPQFFLGVIPGLSLFLLGVRGFTRDSNRKADRSKEESESNG